MLMLSVLGHFLVLNQVASRESCMSSQPGILYETSLGKCSRLVNA